MPEGKEYLSSPIEYLKGVGPGKGELLKKELGIHTFRDLLLDFPFRYVDKTEFHNIKDIHPQSDAVQLVGKFVHLEMTGTGRKKRLTGLFKDNTGSIEVIWFQGAKWMQEFIKLNLAYVIYGKPNNYQGRISLPHPEVELLTQSKSTEASLVPVYSSTERLDGKNLGSKGRRKLVKMLLEGLRPAHIPDNLPSYLLEKLRIEGRYRTLKNIHFPKDHEAKKKAVNRIKFEELFFLQLSILLTKHRRVTEIKGYPFEIVGDQFLTFYEKNLPFELTGAQKKVMKEIRQDLGSGKQMNRLLQGDVGSGKTVIAVMCALLAIDNGYQACVLAPTEILAQQHFHSFKKYMEGLNVKVAFLSGSIKGAARKKVFASLENDEVDILIGTHAIIEETVQFKRLGLAVTDEQHRFGVAQRAKLWKKGGISPPHVLVMTATPIPRTLAMTVYGDLDISIIDELPPGRKPIRTMRKTESHRTQIVKFMREQIAKGRQIYVIYPLIEESEKLDLQDLQAGYEELLHYFPRPEYQIGVVHGRMKPADKELEMQRFLNKKTQILVSTTVIEVGVDVPNATMMIIENAERFGLSQMHQLRGRVGRGGDQSYCILLTSYKVSKQAHERIEMMIKSTSGFEIAEADLRLRGAGEIIGTRQSGALEFKLVNLATDTAILHTARQLAQNVLDDDPQIQQDKNRPIKTYMAQSRRYGRDWSRIS